MIYNSINILNNIVNMSISNSNWDYINYKYIYYNNVVIGNSTIILLVI
jgi:hypothetical protein